MSHKQTGVAWMRRLGDDARVTVDSYLEAIECARSHIGSCRPDGDEPEEQWYWDKLTSLIQIAKGEKQP